MLLRFRLACFVLLALSVPSLASAQATLISGLGGRAGYGTSCIGMNDDGSSNPIDITPYFPGGLRFFDMTHTTVHLNTNGNITFAGPLPTYTPDAFPVAARPMIAPFWADVDTRTPGPPIFPGFPAGCNGPGDGEAVIGPACDNPADNGIWWFAEPASGGRPARAIFTWDRVGYYQCHTDHRMSFQLILTSVSGCGGGSGGTDFDVEFRFNRCEWETGDASGGSGGFGGTPAQSGFDAGNSVDFVEIAGSRTAGIANRLCTMSNVGETGVWRFQIRGGVVLCPDAGDPCTVAGEVGVCAEGRTNCVGGGTECLQQVSPSDERCDALDNDCDGMTDEEDGGPLCGASQQCVRGTCVDVCFEGGCPEGFSCTASGCVETACIDVTCPEGQRCAGGTCVPACDGVVCPHGQSCVGGTCVDVCAGLTCDECTVCDGGACVPRCDRGSACPAGSTCGTDGRCVESACAGVSCSVGTYCSGGACVDACTGAVCPAGDICRAGDCVPAPADGDAGPLPGTDGGGIDPGVDGGGVGPGIDGGIDGGRGPRSPRSGGCCTVAPGAEHGGSDAIVLALAVIALAVARRRRR